MAGRPASKSGGHKKSGAGEGAQKFRLGQRAGNAAAPQFGIVLQISGTGSSETMSEMTARPPFAEDTENLLEQPAFEPASTRFSTQFETTTSTESLAISGCRIRNLRALVSREKGTASAMGCCFKSRSSNSKVQRESWMRPLRNSTFAYPAFPRR